jgi:hypothetical protein
VGVIIAWHHVTRGGEDSGRVVGNSYPNLSNWLPLAKAFLFRSIQIASDWLHERFRKQEA